MPLEKMDFVKKDFQYCWRHTLTRENFDSNIYFEDPISKFTNFTGQACVRCDGDNQQSQLQVGPMHAGYRFNITFLRNFLAPIYEIHDMKQSPDNEYEILTKWSFTMQFWWLRYLPFIKVFCEVCAPYCAVSTAFA